MPLNMNTDQTARVAGHVAKNWFPVNTTHLSEIRAGIAKGAYSKNSLLLDIKSDIALYTLCVRRLAQMAHDGGIGGLTPVELFNHAELDTLTALVNSNIDSEIHLKLQSGSDVQAGRLKASLISATTAEIIVNANSISSELGFSCAVLRQLGLTLIAWNYPHVYRRALENSGIVGTTLESEIQKVLGFTPANLALNIIKDWNLSPVINEVLSEQNSDGGNILSDVATSVIEACRIGESLARANDPENYPSALHDWNTAEEAIEKTLGQKGMIKVRETIARNLRAYATASPKTFSIPAAENIPNRICRFEYSKKLASKNTFLEGCSPLLKMQLRELYSTFTINEIARDSIQKLIRDIIPGAGFERGCIFMFEQSSNSLIPVLKIGAIPEELSKNISLKDTGAKDNYIVSGYLSTNTVKHVKKNEYGEVENTWFCGGLGEEKRTGVLYLEASNSLISRSETNPEVQFLAIKQCLADCLAIK